MSPDVLREKFVAILTPYIADKALLTGLNNDTHLTKDLHINSAHVVDVVIDTELEFDIEIDNDSIDQMTTVGSCVDLILEKMLVDVAR
ncbi:acyl carrier protein [Fibrella aquatilis]|uniref:Acyl carrier protein n=1 Tax=Fibrella aquatilis TaxID=2817059 RepID=A0A939G860_9BACT|nr:acyl carrier protein [Fibrella aquatilis]MBO0932983.1 acyl carrier protein [Fibrella aquatilis]